MKKSGRTKAWFIKPVIVVLILSVTSSVSPIMCSTLPTAVQLMHIEFDQTFSTPFLKDNGDSLEVLVDGADFFSTNPGTPQLPVCTKTFDLPFGTTITDIEITLGDISTIPVQKNVKLVPSPRWLNDGGVVPEKYFTKDTDNNAGVSEWYTCTKGSGVNTHGDHVLHVALHLSPVQYSSEDHLLRYVEHMHVRVTYKQPDVVPFHTPTYDLVIIAPQRFSHALQKLVDHKNSHMMNTTLVTLEDIYNDYQGRDNAEQIKYFIKDALETWNVTYVLLVGSVEKLPIRNIMLYPNDPMFLLLSDLYYADVYDSHGAFCSWDSNGNNIFGEWYYDDVDLYPDVKLGRLACHNQIEVATVVHKIIAYEEKTYGSAWFHQLLLCGGDTFPDNLFINEGEVTNDIVADNMPEFTPIRLWTSTNTFNAEAVNQNINKGVGFIDYSGHGFEIGLGTHPPMNQSWVYYYTYNLFSLLNRNKLPIIFFDACLTAKLDFNITQLLAYLPQNIVDIVTKLPVKGSWLFPCFAWYFIKKPFGGAVATIGATQVAYSYLDQYGAGYLAVHFFKAYEEGCTVSQMLTQSQHDYLNHLGRDCFTLGEFVLLGDPSLRVGGYP